MDLPGKQKSNRFCRCPGSGWKWQLEEMGQGEKGRKREYKMTEIFLFIYFSISRI